MSIVGAVIAVALLATMLVFVLGSGDTNDDKPKDNAIDLEDVLSGQLYAKRFNGSWSSGNSVIYKENAVSAPDLHTQIAYATAYNP